MSGEGRSLGEAETVGYMAVYIDMLVTGGKPCAVDGSGGNQKSKARCSRESALSHYRFGSLMSLTPHPTKIDESQH